MPADDPIFLRINRAQWLWYAAQVDADEREDFELRRDIAEHNAMFWNPQGVEQARNAREKTFVVPDKDFNSIIEQTFGRKIHLPEKPKPGHMHHVSTDRNAKDEGEGPLPRRRNLPAASDSEFLNMELDDIEFTPFSEV